MQTRGRRRGLARALLACIAMESESLRRAGVRLAATLTSLRRESPIVVAIPRSGVVVGYEVARALDAPLDAVPAGKLEWPPGQARPVGGVALGGVRIVDPEASDDLSRDDVERLSEQELRRQQELLIALRGDEPLAALRGRSVILVNDAMVTGLTAEAAIEALRARGVALIHLAVPLGTARATERLRGSIGDIVCLQTVPLAVARRLHQDAHEREPAPSDDQLRALIVHAQQAAGVDLSGGLEIDG